MARTRGPNLARSPIVREVVDLIDKSGWKDWQVAEVAGVSRPYITQLRSGARHEVSVTCIESILGVFGRKLVFGSLKSGRVGSPKHRRKPAHGFDAGMAPKAKRPKRLPYAGAEGRASPHKRISLGEDEWPL